MDVLPFFQPQIIDASQPRRAHLVGIAGNGMRALADVLLGWGWPLSGSDLDITRVQLLLPHRVCDCSKAMPPNTSRRKPNWSSIATPCRRRIPSFAAPPNSAFRR